MLSAAGVGAAAVRPGGGRSRHVWTYLTSQATNQSGAVGATPCSALSTQFAVGVGGRGDEGEPPGDPVAPAAGSRLRACDAVCGRSLAMKAAGPLVAPVVVVLVALASPAAGRAWSAADLLYAESTMYMADGSYFSSQCSLTHPRSTVCNADRLLDREACVRVDRRIADVAHGAGEYALAGLNGPPRGRYVAVVVLREVAAPVDVFARDVFRQWLLLKCGEPQWKGCSNSVVIVVATGRRAVAVYAGDTGAAAAMKGDLAAVEEAMAGRLRLWRNDALSSAVLAGVESVGRLTKFVEPDADDSQNYTFLSFLLLFFVAAAACALRGAGDAPRVAL
jgi:hypothetical protein